MKTLGKAVLFLCLMVGFTLWAAAVLSQQGALGAPSLASAGQREQNAQRDDRLAQRPDRRIDRSGPALSSVSVLRATESYSVTLPAVQLGCIPSPPGESDNVYDALKVCSGQTVSGLVDDVDWDDVYKVWTVVNQTLILSMNGTGVGGPGDADLYLFPPGTTDVGQDPWAARSINYSNTEFIQYTVTEGGYWYIDVFDWFEGDGGTNYNLTVTVSGPGAAARGAFDPADSDRLRVRGGSKGSD
jgi:hypothetical protein